MTNLEKIRKMSAEEMAEFLQNVSYCGSRRCDKCKAGFICNGSGWLGENIVEILNMEVND